MTDSLTEVYSGELRGTLFKLVRKEHPNRSSHMIQFVRMEVVGTGYLVTYRLWNAFPSDPVNADEIRVAFMHEDGIIWDRSTRFPDPGATA